MELEYIWQLQNDIILTGTNSRHYQGPRNLNFNQIFQIFCLIYLERLETNPISYLWTSCQLILDTNISKIGKKIHHTLTTEQAPDRNYLYYVFNHSLQHLHFYMTNLAFCYSLSPILHGLAITPMTVWIGEVRVVCLQSECKQTLFDSAAL